MHYHCPKCLLLVTDQEGDETPVEHKCPLPDTSGPPPDRSIEAIKERYLKATPGPYYKDEKSIMGKLLFTVIRGPNGEYISEVPSYSEQAPGNCEFLLQSWGDMGTVLLALEEEKTKTKALQERIELLENTMVFAGMPTWKEPALPETVTEIEGPVQDRKRV